MINIRMNNVSQTANTKLSPKIYVAGVGGAGGNAVDNMIATNMSGVDFMVCNTDSQALVRSHADTRIQLGTSLTEGLGAGAKPDVGRAAAEETLDDVMQHLDNANMVFITAGMGGGTGTGAAPIIAKACREKGILTVGVVTKPFHFEGSLRMKMAEEGIQEMQHYVDTLIVIPNQNLFRVVNEKTTFADAFKMADGVLQSAVRGVTDLIVIPGLINLDFADIRSVMQEMGKAVMGVGEASGERRATEAAEKAISNPLLDDISMKGARGVIVNVTGGYDMTLFEVDEACNRIRDEVDANANIIFGSSFDEKMEGLMRVSVIATGIDAAVAEKKSRTSSQLASPAAPVGGFTVERQGIGQRAPLQSSVQRTPVQQPVSHQQVAPQQVPAAPMALPVQRPIERPAAAYATAAQSASPLQHFVQQELPVAPITAQAHATQPVQPVFEPAYQPAPQQTLPPQSYQAIIEQAQQPVPNEAARGQRYQGAFIPPQPVESGRASVEDWAGTPAATYAQAPAEAAPQPMAPAAVQTEKKRGSLFERITSGIRREIAQARESDDLAEVTEHGEHQQGLPAGDFRAPQRRAPEMPAQSQAHAAPVHSSPAQGRLNIDSPSAPSQSDELDIPAFLRRQAN